LASGNAPTRRRLPYLLERDCQDDLSTHLFWQFSGKSYAYDIPGQTSIYFHQFVGRMLIAPMIPLALGISGDLFIAIRKVAESAMLARLAALLSLTMFYGMWFGYTTVRRAKHEPADQTKSK
jgi:hypothetical protein